MKSRVWNFSDPKFTKSVEPTTTVNYLFFLVSFYFCLFNRWRKKIEDREREREEKNRGENLFIER